MLDQYREAIAEAVSKARKNRRITQAELAQKLGLSQSRLSQIESSKLSFTAEQFLIILQTFNLPLSHFIPNSIGKEKQVAQIQNSLSRLGASQLKENPDILPSERISEIHQLILETLLYASEARFIIGLIPILAKKCTHVNLEKIYHEFWGLGFKSRFLWLIVGTKKSLEQRLESYLPRDIARIYRQANVRLYNFLLLKSPTLIENEPEDILDPDIASQKTLEDIKESRDELAKEWRIVTRITQQDFLKALIDSEKP